MIKINKMTKVAAIFFVVILISFGVLRVIERYRLWSQTKPQTIMAYTTMHDNNYEIHLYDVQSQLTLKTPPELIQPNKLIMLGPWSPNGRYLPVFIFGTKGDRSASLYWYDSRTYRAKKWYEETERNFANLLNTNSALLRTWENNEKIPLRKSLSSSNEKGSITYLHIDGTLATQEADLDIYTKQNTRIKITTNFYKTTSTTTIDGEKTAWSIGPKTIGVIDEFAIILDKVAATYLKKIQELTNTSGRMTEKELQKFMQTPSQALIDIKNINTGSTIKSIDLSDPIWHVISAKALPERKWVIVHQGNGEVLTSHERFLLVDIEAGKIQRWLTQSTDLDGTSKNATYLHSYGSSFFISDDNKWLITFRDKPRNYTDIIMKNFDTGKMITICTNDCHEMRVYNRDELR